MKRDTDNARPQNLLLVALLIVACIGGRGFGVRREDMKKMILATKGKVFTSKTLNQMIDYTRLKEFRTK